MELAYRETSKWQIYTQQQQQQQQQPQWQVEGGGVGGLLGQEKENVQRMFLFVDWINPRRAYTSDKQYKTAGGKDL